jgi:hypothetical protein
MKTKLLVAIFIGILLVSIALVPLSVYCQDEEPTDTPTDEPNGGGGGPGTNPTATPVAATSTPTTSSSASSSPSSSPTSSSHSGTTHTPTPRVTHHTTPKGTTKAGLSYPLIGGIIVVVVAVLGVMLVFVRKRGVSERSLRKYSSAEFQKWVLKRLEGKTSSSRDISMGIDGFTHRGYPLLIKQTDSVSMTDIERFAGALAKSKMRNGVIVAFGYGGDAVRGRVRARTNYRIDIEMLTVSELIYSKRGY